MELKQSQVSSLLDIQAPFLIVETAEFSNSGRSLKAIGRFTEENSFVRKHLVMYQARNGVVLVPGTVSLEFALQSAALLITDTRVPGNALVTAVHSQFRSPVTLGPAVAEVVLTGLSGNSYSVVVEVIQDASVKLRCSATYLFQPGVTL